MSHDVPQAVLPFINSIERFLIVTHINPDGDALGSSIALALALEAMGRETQIYDRDGVPELYNFLPGRDRVTTQIDEGEVSDMALIMLDCNTPERAGLKDFTFSRSLVIDHHATEKDFGYIKWIDRDSPATGLMVYRLIRELGVKLTYEMALNLYVALSIDTGTFRFSNTTAESLHAAADFVEAGVDAGQVAVRLYQTWSENRYRLLAHNLNNTIFRGRVAVTAITNEMVEETQTRPDDTETFVNYPLLITDVTISALIKQVKEGLWKASLRSKGNINVGKVAEAFGGGGHQNAAGCTVEGNRESVTEKLFEELLKLPAK